MKNKEERSKYSILIVDDERANLHVLFHSLRGEYNVSAANSGKKALEKAKDEIPDLILLDIMMPDMSGYDVLKELKTSSDTNNIPVIFITGLARPEEETKGLFLGAVDYISKPFNVDVVKARVKTHIQIVKQMRLIEDLCMIDPLTEIANRRRFDQQLEMEWKRAIREETSISLLMIDVDDFKLFNDAYGHPAGDNLLQTIAKTGEAQVKRSTDLFARLGGEEFAVLLPLTNPDDAAFVGESIRKAIEELNFPSGIDPRYPVTISIGLESTIPDRNSSIDEFIKRSDEKLYVAKRTGKNKLVCGEGRYSEARKNVPNT